MNASILAVLAAIIAAISMGSIGLISRLSETSSITVTFYRLLLGFVFLLMYLAYTKKITLLRHPPSPLLLLSGTLIAGFILLYTEAMMHTTMLVAVMTLYTAPIFATLINHLWSTDKLTSRSLRSLSISASGFALVMYASGSQLANNLTGFLFSIGAMLCYCAFLLLNKYIGNSHNREHIIDSSWQLAAGALVIFPLLLVQNLGTQEQSSFTLQQWFWLICAGLVPGFLGLTLAVYAIKKLSAASFASLSYLEPVTAFMLGWLWFNENLNHLQWIGVGIIILNSIAELVQTKNSPQAQKVTTS